MGNIYEASKGQYGQISELFRKTDDGRYEECIKGEWVESGDARDVFYGYGTVTFRVPEEEAMKYADAVKNGKYSEYAESFKKGD